MAADQGGDDVVTLGKLNPKLAGEDLTNDVLKVEERANYTNITADTLIKTGAGRVFGILVASHTSGSIKLWDNTSAATTVLLNTYSYSSGSQVISFPAGIEFTTGLYADVTGTQDITILWK